MRLKIQAFLFFLFLFFCYIFFLRVRALEKGLFSQVLLAESLGNCGYELRRDRQPRAIMGQRGNLRALAGICEFHLSYF